MPMLSKELDVNTVVSGYIETEDNPAQAEIIEEEKSFRFAIPAEALRGPTCDTHLHVTHLPM